MTSRPACTDPVGPAASPTAAAQPKTRGRALWGRITNLGDQIERRHFNGDFLGAVVKVVEKSGTAAAEAAAVAAGAATHVGTAAVNGINDVIDEPELQYCGPEEYMQPQKADKTLRVSLFSARGLKQLNLSGDNPWCGCKVMRETANGQMRVSGCRTKVGWNIAPQWNEEHDVVWQIGDSLEFTLFDQGLIANKIHGQVMLPSDSFYPCPYDGEVALYTPSGEITGGSLRMRLAVVGEEDEQASADDAAAAGTGSTSLSCGRSSSSFSATPLAASPSPSPSPSPSYSSSSFSPPVVAPVPGMLTATAATAPTAMAAGTCGRGSRQEFPQPSLWEETQRLQAELLDEREVRRGRIAKLESLDRVIRGLRSELMEERVQLNELEDEEQNQKRLEQSDETQRELDDLQARHYKLKGVHIHQEAERRQLLAQAAAAAARTARNHRECEEEGYRAWARPGPETDALKEAKLELAQVTIDLDLVRLERRRDLNALMEELEVAEAENIRLKKGPDHYVAPGNSFRASLSRLFKVAAGRGGEQVHLEVGMGN